VTRFRVIPERSQVWIEARSSLHPIHGEGTGIQGEAELEVNDGQIDLSVPAQRAHRIPGGTAELRECSPGHGDAPQG